MTSNQFHEPESDSAVATQQEPSATSTGPTVHYETPTLHPGTTEDDLNRWLDQCLRAAAAFYEAQDKPDVAYACLKGVPEA